MDISERGVFIDFFPDVEKWVFLCLLLRVDVDFYLLSITGHAVLQK